MKDAEMETLGSDNSLGILTGKISQKAVAKGKQGVKEWVRLLLRREISEHVQMPVRKPFQWEMLKIEGEEKMSYLRLQRSEKGMKSWARRMGSAIVKKKDICILGLEKGNRMGRGWGESQVGDMEWVRVWGSSCAMAFVFTWREDKLMSCECWESGDRDSREEVSFCKWRISGSCLEKHRRVASDVGACENPYVAFSSSTQELRCWFCPTVEEWDLRRWKDWLRVDILLSKYNPSTRAIILFWKRRAGIAERTREKPREEKDFSRWPTVSSVVRWPKR